MFLDEQRRDQEAGNDEKDLDTKKARLGFQHRRNAGQILTVIQDHRDDRDGSQAIEPGDVRQTVYRPGARRLRRHGSGSDKFSRGGEERK